jgi:hypothetical protein
MKMDEDQELSRPLKKLAGLKTSNQKQVLEEGESQKAVFGGPMKDLEIDFCPVFDGSLHNSHPSLFPVHLCLCRNPERKVEEILPKVSLRIKARPLILSEHVLTLCLAVPLDCPVGHKEGSVLFLVVMMAFDRLYRMYRDPIVPDPDHHGTMVEALCHLFYLGNLGRHHVLDLDYHHASLLLCRGLDHP